MLGVQIEYELAVATINWHNIINFKVQTGSKSICRKKLSATLTQFQLTLDSAQIINSNLNSALYHYPAPNTDSTGQ